MWLNILFRCVPLAHNLNISSTNCETQSRSLCIIELYYIKKSTQLPYSIELYNELTFLKFIVHKKLASANSMECMFHVSTFIDVASF